MRFLDISFAGAPTVTPVGARALARQKVSVQVWDQAVAHFDDVCQEQLALFAGTRWPRILREPVLFWQGGEVVGGALVMVQPLALASVAVVKWGPLLARADHPQRDLIYAEMVEHLVEEYAERRRMMLSILPRASIEAENAEYRLLLERGFRPGPELGFPDRYVVDVRLSDADQLMSFHQKWRYQLHKSERGGLEFEVAPPGRFAAFDTLYRQMLARKRFVDYSAYETLPNLMASANDALRPALFFVNHEGQPIAGGVIFTAGDRAVYLYGATSDRSLPLRAGYFMHWHIIRWLRDNTGARWYDLGGSDGYDGLHQFKIGMVGRAGVVRPVPPVANYAAHWWPRFAGNAAFQTRDALAVIKREFRRLRGGHTRPEGQSARAGQMS